MVFRIQYASHLFVDCHSVPFSKLVRPPSVHTPFLALCGNIGNPFHPRTQDFLRYCSNHWKQTFWIPSSQEISGQETPIPFYQYSDKAYELTQTIKNIHFMHQGQAEFPKQNILLLGASLWPSYTCEFQNIWRNPRENQRMNESVMKSWHEEDKEFLRGQLIYASNWKSVRVILLTHTLSTSWILSSNLSMKTNILKEEDRRKLFRPPVKIWLSGATGSCKNGLVDGIFCGVNSRWEHHKDATNERKNPSYLPTLFAELPEISHPPESAFPSSNHGLGLPIQVPYLFAHKKGHTPCVSNSPVIYT
jgi:hypothetical protein